MLRPTGTAMPDADKMAKIGNSTNIVAVDTRNLPPMFVDQDTETDGVQNTMATREVEENTKALAGTGNTGDDDAATSTVLRTTWAVR